MNSEVRCIEASGRSLEVLLPGHRVLVAGLYHCTNTFLGGKSRLEDFEVTRGDELLRTPGDASPVAGIMDVAREKGWEVVPALDVRALPGPTVADSVVELFWAEVQAVADAEAAAGGIDGVFLILHGSMVSESLPDVEGEILRRLRGVEHLSDAPICGVMDLHANFTEAMARQADGLIACRETPRADTREAAMYAANLLDRLMQMEDRPATVWEHPPILWPPGGVATDVEPMLGLERRAREIEKESADVLAMNVCAGFPFADIPEAGVSFSAITTGDLEQARAKTRELNVLASARRDLGYRPGIPLEEAMLRLQRHQKGPVLVIEPSDSVAAGAPGDGTSILRAFVEWGVSGAGVIINDPETVEFLQDVELGDRTEVAIGGKSGEVGEGPLRLEVEVMSKSDGKFMPRSTLSRFMYVLDKPVEMGPCAVVRHGGVTILLTSRRTSPFDLEQWRSQGVEPEDLYAIGVKASVEHRPAYEPIAEASYTVDVPGPCPEDLRRLPFERVSRPIYPVDDI